MMHRMRADGRSTGLRTEAAGTAMSKIDGGMWVHKQHEWRSRVYRMKLPDAVEREC